MLTISGKGRNVIKAFEGCSLRAYRDSVGVWTIGFGITNMDKNIPWKVQAGLTITQAEADTELDKSLADNYEPAVRRALPDCTQPQFDAGDSFHFNTGAIGRATWPRLVNAKDMAGARLSIMSWNKAGGSVLAGLTRRRKREWSMIESGDYGVEGNDHTPTVITRNEDGSGPLVGTPVTRPGPGMIGLHDTGPEVTEAQGWLKKLGFKCGSTPGTFGADDEAAVVAFQKSHNQLNVDGVIGPATSSAIRRDLAARKNTATGAKGVASAGVSAAVAWKTVGAKLAFGIVGLTGVAVLGLGVYLLYRYRDEIMARVNRLIGRQVP